MISTLLIDKDKTALTNLEQLLINHCPHISICGKIGSYKDVLENIETLNPDLVFLDIDVPQIDTKYVFDIFRPFNCEVIITSETDKHAVNALNNSVSGYLLKPIQKDELVKTVKNASKRIRNKQRLKSNSTNQSSSQNNNKSKEVIGIPTTEGYEFILVNDIIRCEGMQKCTRIITNEKTDLISSYNLGEFKKLLDKYGFYSPHKSHLINLNMIRKYHKEGNLLMCNGSWVPVAKRRKKDFLNRIQHI